MSFTFRPAKREGVTLLIGLAGASGSGKTFSAMTLAQGMAGDSPFAVIDTEAGRAKHYADRFKFHHGDLTAPYTPERYKEAVMAADAAGYPVIVIDSASHEYAGEGGVLDMQEAEFQRMGARDAVKMASWIKPKGEHKKFVTKLLQIRAHVILCLRADEKIEIRRVKGRDGRETMEVVPKTTLAGYRGWVPICEKSLPYELTASFVLIPDQPGVPHVIKLEAQHRPFFPLDKPITQEAGRQLADWARGGSAAPTGPARQILSADVTGTPSADAPSVGVGDRGFDIDLPKHDAVMALQKAMRDSGIKTMRGALAWYRDYFGTDSPPWQTMDIEDIERATRTLKPSEEKAHG